MEETKDNMTAPAANDASPATVPSASPEPTSTDVEVPEDDRGEESPSEAIAKLPDSVRNYLHSDLLAERHADIYAKHGVDGEFADVVYLTELDVFTGKEYPDMFFDVLWARCPWPDEDEEKAKALAVDLLGNVMLPAQVYLGDVNGAIAELGGDPASFDVEPLKVRELSYDEGADKVLALLQGEGIDDSDVSRLRHIIDSRLRDVRDDAETKRMLTKERKVGGLNLPDAQADRVMAALAAEMRMTVFMEAAAIEERKKAERKPVSAPASAEAPAPVGTPASTPSAPPVRASAPATKRQEEEPEWTPERIKAVYIGHPNEQRELLMRVETLRSETGGNVESLRDRLYEALHPAQSSAGADRLGVVAALVSLAQHNGLIKTLIDDERYREVVERYVSENRPQDADVIRRAPGGRVAMNIFLQLLLKTAISLDDNDSARYGLRIINMLKKMGETQYADLVAFDTDQGGFRWTEPLDL